MGYITVWKVLDEMITDFRRRGTDVPSVTVDNMKNAKTIIGIMQNNTECREDLQRIEQYLGTVEIYLVSEGEKRFGKKYADRWLVRINEASRKMPDDEEEKQRFIPGLPRQQSWLRVKPSAELPLQKLKTLARKQGLRHTEQAESTLLVYGSKENLKDFVKKIATEHKLETGKRH